MQDNQEKAEHLQADIERLDNEKKELDKRIKELGAGKDESEKVRDKEMADLKQTIKELTEVKMERQKSEERLKKQSEEFLKVMEMNQLVNDILGEYSNKTGLLLRSQEVVNKLKAERAKNEVVPPTGWETTTTNLTIDASNRKQFLNDKNE